jgi:hypothetical protein
LQQSPPFFPSSIFDRHVCLTSCLLCLDVGVSEAFNMTNLVENRGPALLGVNVAFCILAGVVVILRCYTRAVLVKAFGLDDWTMVLATVCLANERNGHAGVELTLAAFIISGLLHYILRHVQLRRVPWHRAAHG